MNDSDNTHILNVIIEYILSTERFNVPFLNKSNKAEPASTTHYDYNNK